MNPDANSKRISKPKSITHYIQVSRNSISYHEFNLEFSKKLKPLNEWMDHIFLVPQMTERIDRLPITRIHCQLSSNTNLPCLDSLFRLLSFAILTSILIQVSVTLLNSCLQNQKSQSCISSFFFPRGAYLQIETLQLLKILNLISRTK